MTEPIFNRQRLYKLLLIPAVLVFSAFKGDAGQFHQITCTKAPTNPPRKGGLLRINEAKVSPTGGDLAGAPPQQTTGIILHDEQIGITPKEFYIADVRDERDNRTAIAWLLPPGNNPGTKPEASPVDFDGGFAAIKQFILKNLPRNTALRPVVVSIKKFTTNETANAGGSIDGHVALQLSFSLQNSENELVGLGDYHGSATYKRQPRPQQNIEPILRQALKNGLIYINTWMDRQAAVNVKLATGVKVIFTDYQDTTNGKGDTIYYSVKRPLAWDDFQSKTGNSRYDAEVFPSIGYNEYNEINNSIVNIHLSIKVFVPKSACWVQNGSQNEYALNHEQRHFDIAKIAAEHFKQRLKAENLPVNNFDGYINSDYLDAYREMDELQKQYDDETGHGSDRLAQQRWNERIDKELKTYHIK